MQTGMGRAPVAVVLKDLSIGVAPGVRVLKARDYAQLVEAEQALLSARAQAADIVAHADSVREDARRCGQEQGRVDVQQELFSSVAELQSKLVHWVRETEPQLLDLVMRCVREIVRSADVSALVQDSVHRALAEMTAAQDIRIQVHESQVEGLREQLRDLMEQHALRGAVRVEPALALKPGDCIVESPLGVVDLRVESQLKFVQQVLQP